METKTCPLCEREGVAFEAHHLQTRRKDRHDTEDICVECHKSIHGLFTQRELRDTRLGLDTIEGLLGNERFAKALTFIKKIPPGSQMKMRQARSRRHRR